MTDRVIGIPAASRGGLVAAASPNPEEAAFLVILTHDGSQVTNTVVAAVPPPEWLSDGFAAGLLARHQVVELVAAEMDPYLFAQLSGYGLKLWAQNDRPTVGDQLEALLADELEPFDMEVPDEVYEAPPAPSEDD